MQRTLRTGRLKRMMDDVGLRALILVLSVGWFTLLWGLGVPAIAAGLALGLLGQLALTRYRLDSAANREASLRRRIGGELLLEELVLSGPEEADAAAAALLRRAYPDLGPGEAVPGGVLCGYREERLLLRCLARPSAAEMTLEDAAIIARACRAAGADRAIVCVLCHVSRQTAAYVDSLPVQMRIVPRETVLRLAGEAAPVTDAQLVALGAREHKLTPTDMARGALRRVKAKRYMTYGLALLLLYVITGLRYYPVPGAICMLLAVGSRCVREEPEPL